MKELTIHHLYELPQETSRVAEWIYREFWMDKEGYRPEHFEHLLLKATSKNEMPLSLLARVGEEPAGTINLIENDDERRTHLRPWLAALYVVPKFRRKGVGGTLVRALLDEAWRLNFNELYLGTDNPTFYKKLGATFFEQANKELVIMKFERNGINIGEQRKNEEEKNHDC
jgi:predicted N-acetyltransferase YhbS